MNYIVRRYIVLIIAIIAICCVSDAQSNSFERQGTTFVSKSKSRNKTEPTKTKYTWKDSKGNIYPVYISSNGSCFIIKTSAKTGKQYRNYLDAEISKQICKELGVKYKSKSKT